MSDTITTPETPIAQDRKKQLFSLKRLRNSFRQPSFILGLMLFILLVLLVLMPLLRLVTTTLTGDGLEAWNDVLNSRLSENLFWRPLGNTLAIGATVALGTLMIGGFLAWLVVMTDMPGRGVIGAMAAIPFALPSFAIALAWETIFRNDRVGGQIGVLQDLGLSIPDWLAWGFIPVVLTLVAHYYSLAFVLISASLASVNTELLEAAEMTGANRRRVLTDITLPVVAPAIVSSALLAFAEGVSNFAAPALLGLPVRFHTISTRLYGSISTGQVERGYVLAILLILVAAVLLWSSTRFVSGRRSFATITGKGGRRKRQQLGGLRWPLFGAALSICVATTILPTLALLGSSFARSTGSLTSGFTSHFWIGGSDPSFAQGQPGVLRNEQVVEASANTMMLGLSVSLAAIVLGLAIGYVVIRGRKGPMTSSVGLLSYLPFLIPGVAFGAVYIAQYGRPFGPLPALYGTFALLVIAGAAYNLPFASQSGRSAMSQVAGELEEAAVMSGARFMRRLTSIFIPLTSRGLIAGAVLVFVNVVRDLALVVLLVTPTMPLLSVITFRYASEGFAQFANAITVIIATISIAATLLARRLQGAVQPWNEK
ncbi:MAG: iron ABC transporter permease [Chloroflexota bacterium]